MKKDELVSVADMLCKKHDFTLQEFEFFLSNLGFIQLAMKRANLPDGKEYAFSPKVESLLKDLKELGIVERMEIKQYDKEDGK